MENKKYWWVGLAVFIVAAFAITAVVRDLSSGDTQPGNGVANNISDQVSDAASNDSDNNSPTPLSSGDDQSITNKAEGYSFTVPTNWYVEKNASDDLAIYPDYDPHASSSPECKIEISMLAGDGAKQMSAADLSAWLTQYLHADPTATVTELSRRNIEIGSASGIEWSGILNGVMTTLAYVPAGGDAQGKVLEIAPSVISSNSDTDNDGDESGDCNLDFEALLANIKIQ